MMIPQRLAFFQPQQFAIASAGVMGTTQKFAIDRTWPIEEIILVANITCGATGPTLRTGSTGVSGVDNVLACIKRVNLSINDGVQPRSVVDATGPGLLEYASVVGLNLDRTTLDSVRLCQAASLANNLNLRVAYRIPMVSPMIDEPLRSRMLLPVHTWPQDPILTIDFASATEMYSAGSISAISVDVVLIRRQMDASVTQQFMNSGGFIPFDLVETPFVIPTGTSGELRFAVPTPGSYMHLQARQYLGGATMVRDVVDQVTTVGSESPWRLESGGVVARQWRWKHLQIINDYSRVANDVTQTSSPNFAGAVAANTNYQPAASVLLDFLSDGLEGANELGGLLDTNLPTQSGLKMEIIGSVASVATQGSVLTMMGHRLFGDLSRWKAIKT